MLKILIGLFAAIIIAAGAFFGFEFYVQQRAASEVEAAFAQVRAAGNKATYGKVSFDLFSRTITVADIAGETAAQPPVSVKIGSFKASGVSQPDASRFTADTIDAENVEVIGTMAAQAGWRATYKAPKISVVGYSGPAGPLRQVDPASPTDVYRFVLEHFAAVTAASITAPTLATAVSMGGGATSGTGDYTYSGIALRDIKDGKIAATTIDRMVFSANMSVSGKPEKINGDVAGFATSDFDAAGATIILDPAHANDDKYYRVYRQATVGAYTITSEKGLRIRIDGMTIDDIGIRPSRLQLPSLIALIQQMPAAGTTPTPAQTRDLLEKVAGIYEGLRIGNAELRGLAFDMPEAPFRLAAIRFNLENGKIGEFAIEGLDARSPKGPVKVARFALKSLDIANLLRMSSQLDPGQKPSPDQLLALLLLLEGTEIKGVVAPYKDSTKPVNIDTLNLNWGQFVGPIPSRARLTLKMTGPIDASDPDPFKMLVTAGKEQAAVNFDLGATWTEGSRTFMLAPVTAEIGEVGTAAARISFSNVPREVFSINPLQAAIMAAQIEAGTIEIALRDIGGVDLAVAQYARTQKLTPDAARRAIVENIKTTGMTMATTNPDAMAIAGAVTRFIENPRGTLTVKLTPKGKVPAMSLIEAIKASPLTALAKFQVEASTGR
jgi:hypothetical protein